MKKSDNRKLWKAAFVLVFLFGFSLLIFKIFKGSYTNSKFVTVTIGGTKVKAELAISDEEKARGLSYRSFLAKDQGMLFIFPEKTIPAFWMKGMRFPLDIIWIADGEVKDVSENLPVIKTSDKSLPHYSPKVPIDMVLEVNAGFVKEYNISEGTKVQITWEL